MAFGAVIAARDLGLAIPDDVSLIGVDDHEVAEVMGLTTVRQRVVEHGALAARALLRRLTGEPLARGVEHLVSDAELVVRSSTRAPTASLTSRCGYESVCKGPGPRPATARGISMRKRWLRLAALPVAFAFVAAACSTSDDDDDAGGDGTEAPADTGGEGTERHGHHARTGTAPATTAPLAEPIGPGSAGSVTVFGVEESENEAGAMQDALTEFGEANGIDITYVGRRDFEQQINVQVLGGNPPDIAAFPQPGKVIQFAQDGELHPGPRRRRGVGVGELGRGLPGEHERRRHPVRRAVQVRPQVDRVVHPQRLGGEGLHGPRDPHRLQGARWTR